MGEFSLYNKSYYQKHRHGSYRSAMKILGCLTKLIDIKSMFDFGCGIGTWCLAAQELGISDVKGIDQSPYDGDHMLIPHKDYMQINLQNSVSLYSKADLVISVEVGEHIEDRYSHILVDTLCRHGDLVLFSAALPYQGGTGHVNEQPCSYWRNIFEKSGYCAFDCIRALCWEDDEVEIWYKNNCILYAKNGVHVNKFDNIHIRPPIDIIHPDMLKRILTKWGEQ